ncbi:MAG: hypothetical protein WCN95_14835, partial [bacterium]
MRSNVQRLHIVILLVSAVSCRGHAQGLVQTPEKPQLFKLRNCDSSLVIEAEQRNQETRAKDGSQSVSEDALWIRPLLHLNMSGSIVHPNFLEFTFDGEVGASWENGEIRTFESPASDTAIPRGGTTALQRYDAQLLLLKKKDYPVVFSAGHAVARRDYDFFRRVTVDTDHYGLNWSLRDKTWPMSVSLSRRVEDLADIDRPEKDENNRILLTLHNQRSTHDASDARYSLDQYQYERSYYPEQHGINHSLQFLDLQTFGNPSYTPQKGSSLKSRLDINERNAVFEPSTNSATQLTRTSDDSRRLAVMEELKLQHTDSLSSFYNYNFADNTTEQVANRQHQGSAGLRHQPYDNLTTVADVHGRMISNAGNDWDNETRMVGGRANTAYTGNLSTWGRLILGGGLGLDSERRNSSGGSLSIVNEDCHLVSGRLTVLKYPNVVPSSVVVTDGSGTIW